MQKKESISAKKDLFRK